jgi:hypothetical protein
VFKTGDCSLRIATICSSLNLVFFIGFLIEVKLENQILTCMKKPATYRLFIHFTKAFAGAAFQSHFLPVLQCFTTALDCIWDDLLLEK